MELLTGRRPRAALFDFNGTISLDEPILDRLFREAFAAIGIELDSEQYYAELSGLSDPEIVVRALELHGRPAEPELCERLLRAKIDRYKQVVLQEPTVPPAVVGFVRAVAERVPVAIGSGAVREEILHVLDQHGLRQLFGVLVAIDDVEHGKPDPETYLRCLALLRRRAPRPGGGGLPGVARTPGSASPRRTPPACGASRSTPPATWSGLRRPTWSCKVSPASALGLFGTEVR